MHKQVDRAYLITLVSLFSIWNGNTIGLCLSMFTAKVKDAQKDVKVSIYSKLI